MVKMYIVWQFFIHEGEAKSVLRCMSHKLHILTNIFLKNKTATTKTSHKTK